MDKIDKLKKYGVDIELTLDRFLGDEDFYLECIEAFLDETIFDDLIKAINSGNYNNAFEHAHNLKGVLANLGLQKILTPTEELVEKLRENDYEDIDLYLAKIINEREKFLTVVK